MTGFKWSDLANKASQLFASLLEAQRLRGSGWTTLEVVGSAPMATSESLSGLGTLRPRTLLGLPFGARFAVSILRTPHFEPHLHGLPLPDTPEFGAGQRLGAAWAVFCVKTCGFVMPSLTGFACCPVLLRVLRSPAATVRVFRCAPNSASEVHNSRSHSIPRDVAELLFQRCTPLLHRRTGAQHICRSSVLAPCPRRPNSAGQDGGVEAGSRRSRTTSSRASSSTCLRTRALVSTHPAALAALTASLAENGVLLEDVRAGHRALLRAEWGLGAGGEGVGGGGSCAREARACAARARQRSRPSPRCGRGGEQGAARARAAVGLVARGAGEGAHRQGHGEAQQEESFEQNQAEFFAARHRETVETAQRKHDAAEAFRKKLAEEQAAKFAAKGRPSRASSRIATASAAGRRARRSSAATSATRRSRRARCSLRRSATDLFNRSMDFAAKVEMCGERSRTTLPLALALALGLALAPAPAWSCPHKPDSKMLGGANRRC